MNLNQYNVTNSGYYPHIDDLQYENTLQHICLINLNDIPISTNFYTFKNQNIVVVKYMMNGENIQKTLEKSC